MSSPEETPGEACDPIERELRRVGERVREDILRRGAELVGPEDEEEARASMLAIMRAQVVGRTPERKRRNAVLLLSLTAAALLLALASAFWLRKADGPHPVPLGPGGIRILSPRGAVSSFSSFLWEGELPEGGSFELRILDRNGTVLVEKKLEEPRWSPTEEVTLPERIRWEVRVVDRMREPHASAGAEAWLSH